MIQSAAPGLYRSLFLSSFSLSDTWPAWFHSVYSEDLSGYPPAICLLLIHLPPPTSSSLFGQVRCFLFRCECTGLWTLSWVQLFVVGLRQPKFPFSAPPPLCLTPGCNAWPLWGSTDKQGSVERATLQMGCSADVLCTWKKQNKTFHHENVSEAFKIASSDTAYNASQRKLCMFCYVCYVCL